MLRTPSLSSEPQIHRPQPRKPSFLMQSLAREGLWGITEADDSNAGLDFTMLLLVLVVVYKAKWLL